MGKIIVNEAVCKGCGLCVDACPKKIIILDTERLNVKGIHPAALTDEKICIGCAMCATICPDCAIEVYR